MVIWGSRCWSFLGILWKIVRGIVWDWGSIFSVLGGILTVRVLFIYYLRLLKPVIRTK